MSIKVKTIGTKPNLNHFVKPHFEGVNILFVLAFENDAQRTSNKRYHLLNVEIKDYNILIDGKTFSINQWKITKNIRKIGPG